jgi:hypothetical protein
MHGRLLSSLSKREGGARALPASILGWFKRKNRRLSPLRQDSALASDEDETAGLDERLKIREDRLETFLEWGLPLDVARALMRADYVPKYDVYRLREKGATPEEILECLL